MVLATRKVQFVTQLKAERPNGETATAISDVGSQNGGFNLGFDPHQMLEASLAACTSITIQMYANRKAIPLASADVTVNFKSEGAQTVLVREVKLNGDLNPEQRALLMTIADKCPIHKVLISQMKIETTEIPAIV